MSVITFLKGLLQKAIDLFHKVENVEKEVFTEADAFVDKVKTLEKSEVVQFLETGIETAFPATTPIINTIRMWLTSTSAKLANVQDTVVKDEDKVSAFLDHLNTLKVSDPVLYAGILTTLNASYQQMRINLSDNPPVLPPQTSLVAAVAVHTNGTLNLPE